MLSRIEYRKSKKNLTLCVFRFSVESIFVFWRFGRSACHAYCVSPFALRRTARLLAAPQIIGCMVSTRPCCDSHSRIGPNRKNLLRQKKRIPSIGEMLTFGAVFFFFRCNYWKNIFTVSPVQTLVTETFSVFFFCLLLSPLILFIFIFLFDNRQRDAIGVVELFMKFLLFVSCVCSIHSIHLERVLLFLVSWNIDRREWNWFVFVTSFERKKNNP